MREGKKHPFAINVWRWGLLILLLVLWEIGARLKWIDPFFFSSPLEIVRTAVIKWQGGTLWRDIAYTGASTLLGFVLGPAIGSIVGLLFWFSRPVAQVAEPWLIVLNALPKTALGPIFIVWMGAGMGAIVTMTLAISLIVTILSMYTGFRTTDSEKLRLMRTLGADKRQILWLLVFPANCPTLFSTLKVNVGLSWVGVIMGEFLVSRAGLGYLIVYGSQVFNMDLVMASVLVLGLAAVGMYLLVLRAERFFYLWNALNTLPETQGRRVEACVIDGKRFSEVGRAEGVHSGSVRGSVLRGLESMKEYLKENW